MGCEAAGRAEPAGPVLVTGGTGTLGRAVVRRLLERGQAVRVLSRRPADGAPETAPASGGEGEDRGPGGTTSVRARPERAGPERARPERVTGDLVSGAGLDAAVAGVAGVVHCATTGTGKDVAATRHLIEAMRRSEGNPHLIYVSIVGVDRVPLFYYRAKLAAERAVEASKLPWTILRATQFHDLIARLTRVQRLLPCTLYPAGFSFQPVEVEEVAERLVELALGAPAGRVADMGGPEVLTARELARLTLRAYGRRRPLLPVPLAGRTARGYKAGHHTTPAVNAVGRTTYREYLAAVAPGRR